MEIVIENPSEASSPSLGSAATSPSLVMHPPPLRGFPGIYGPDGGGSTSMLVSAPEYYARQRSHPLLAMSNELDGASATNVRRVDRSGLLEIPEMEPARRPRLLTGAENVSTHMGTLSRRVDRTGLLEAVPEVPDQQGQKSPENSSRTNEDDVQGQSITERHLTGAEAVDDQCSAGLSPCASRSPVDYTSSTSLNRGRSQGSLDEIEPRRLLPETRTITGSPQDFHSTSGSLKKPSPTSPNPYYRFQGSSPITMTSLRTSPLVGACADGDNTCRNRVQFCPSSKFVPIEPHTHANLPADRQYSGTCLNSPPTLVSRSCSTNFTAEEILSDSSATKDKKDCLGRLSPGPRSDRRSPMTLSVVPDVIEAHGSNIRTEMENNSDAPEGERAEAEGCEHTAVDSVEEARVTFKAPNKLLHNENVQTLRVIILSEQL